MPQNNAILGDVIEMNLLYLSFVQRRLREDKEEAKKMLGMSAEIADVLCQMTEAQAIKLARSAQLLCRFQWDDHTILSRLAEKMATPPTIRAAMDIGLAA